MKVIGDRREMSCLGYQFLWPLYFYTSQYEDSTGRLSYLYYAMQNMVLSL